MADICSLQVVNATSQLLDASYNHAYQMETWSFSNVGSLNYQSFPVSFFDGSHDEDDGAEQNYAYNGSDLIQLQARSDDHSNHFLRVQAVGNVPSGIVLVINGTSTVYKPSLQNSLQWMSMPSASSGILIGNIPTNQTILGVGVVDLTLLFSDPNQVSEYIEAIDAGNLTNAQAVALSNALNQAIQGTPAASTLVGATH